MLTHFILLVQGKVNLISLVLPVKCYDSNWATESEYYICTLQFYWVTLLPVGFVLYKWCIILSWLWNATGKVGPQSGYYMYNVYFYWVTWRYICCIHKHISAVIAVIDIKHCFCFIPRFSKLYNINQHPKLVLSSL